MSPAAGNNSVGIPHCPLDLCFEKPDQGDSGKIKLTDDIASLSGIVGVPLAYKGEIHFFFFLTLFIRVRLAVAGLLSFSTSLL